VQGNPVDDRDVGWGKRRAAVDLDPLAVPEPPMRDRDVNRGAVGRAQLVQRGG